jgi:hypothetical protein
MAWIEKASRLKRPIVLLQISLFYRRSSMAGQDLFNFFDCSEDSSRVREWHAGAQEQWRVAKAAAAARERDGDRRRNLEVLQWEQEERPN